MTTVHSVRVPRLRRPETVPMGLKVSVGKSLRPAVQRIVQELKPEKSYSVRLLRIRNTRSPQRCRPVGRYENKCLP